jgi:hypothetical protein
MSQTIEVTISPTGETQIEAKGFEGSRCRDATRALEAALGVRSSEELRPEFYAETTTDETESQRP